MDHRFIPNMNAKASKVPPGVTVQRLVTEAYSDLIVYSKIQEETWNIDYVSRHHPTGINLFDTEPVELFESLKVVRLLLIEARTQIFMYLSLAFETSHGVRRYMERSWDGNFARHAARYVFLQP